MAISNIDARLSKKIDNLEASVAVSIDKVKTDVNSKITEFSNEMDQRFNAFATSTQSLCEGYASKVENMQYVNESRFNKLERELLRNELIVTGVPVTHGESMFDIMGDIVTALQSNVISSDIVAFYRLPVRKNSSGKTNNDRFSAPIVLKLGSDWAKQELLSKYFKTKSLNTGDIGFQSKARIYINESLTVHNRAVFKAASEAKKAKLITKCYTRNGIVHIQATTDGNIFRINDVDQLNAIISSRPNSTTQSNSKSSVQTKTQHSTSPTTEHVKPTDGTTNPGSVPAMHDGERMEGH